MKSTGNEAGGLGLMDYDNRARVADDARIVFSLGDLVRLRSGGPVMTVAAIGESQRGPGIGVADLLWFEAGSIKRVERVPLETLEGYSREEPAKEIEQGSKGWSALMREVWVRR